MKSRSLGTTSPNSLFKNKMQTAWDVSEPAELPREKVRHSKRIEQSKKRKKSYERYGD